MAISQQQKDEILSVVVSLFNGAPGGAILDDLAKAVEDGVPIYEISRLLAETNQFKALTSDKTTIPQQVEFLLDHFGFAPGGEPGSAAALAEEYFTLMN
ncbi:hypothetical protein [Nitrosomonas halophila]|uniref:Uncharacterized protein n=1 Tax=Nitrosomonas halophila TaxID=44576 RepID=A0A1H3N5V9_9PROT|nr:hypothetical protein [Nitrosomonas halophila]SDY84256.1 hypothetical protein SAMN05421881_106810 [Nitrosomonas halophila]